MQELPDQTADPAAQDYAAKRRVTLVGAVVNLFLAGGKIGAGIVGHSQALVADGVHSLSDLLSDGLVLVAARWGSQAADRDHPYGHARIETAATALIGALLLMIAGSFVFDSITRLLDPGALLTPGVIALAAAILSVLAKEVLYHYTRVVANRTASALIEANAWHHRSDALSSVVVIIGVTGAMLGAPWLDAVAAIVVAAFLGRMGWRFIRRSVEELVDTGLPPEEIDELREIINSVTGVRGHHRLRTRRMGGQTVMDVHLELDPGIRLSEANRIATRVRQRLLEKTSGMLDVLVCVEPNDELAHPPAESLPSRQTISYDLAEAWRDIPDLPDSRSLLLHYRATGVDVDLIVATNAGAGELPRLRRRLEVSSSHLLYMGRLRVMISEPGATDDPADVES